MDFSAETITRYTLAIFGGYLVGALSFSLLTHRLFPSKPRLSRLLGGMFDGAKVAVLFFVWFYNSSYWWPDYIDFSWSWADYFWQQIKDPSSSTFAAVACTSAVAGHRCPIFRKHNAGIGIAPFTGFLVAVAWPGSLIFLTLWAVTGLALRQRRYGAAAAAIATPICLFLALGPLMDLTFLLIERVAEGPLRNWIVVTIPSETGFVAISLAALLIAWRSWVAPVRAQAIASN